MVLDEYINQNNYINENYKNESIILPAFMTNEEIEYDKGKIIFVPKNDYKFLHSCNTDPGSSGGPIILINNFSVIGLHKGYDKENNKNVGIFLREIINNINENNILKINKKISLNNESEKEIKKIIFLIIFMNKML